MQIPHWMLIASARNDNQRVRGPISDCFSRARAFDGARRTRDESISSVIPEIDSARATVKIDEKGQHRIVSGHEGEREFCRQETSGNR